MPRWLPSLNAVRAFEAAARHLSFTRAADELGVTQGAVSHQVKALEEQLGRRLFHRRHQHLVLTETGHGCLPYVRDGLDQIGAGFARIREREEVGILTVSVSPNFAAKWLVGRLSRFTREHPDIDLRISATLHHVDFTNEDVDIAVRHGDGNWSDLDVTCLIKEELFAVCSPQLLRGATPLREPHDLRHHTLIHLGSPDDWRRWLNAVGAPAVPVRPGVVFNERSMAIDAAVGGQGIALARSALVATDLIAGRLVRPFALSLPVSMAYYIVCPKVAAKRPRLTLFRDWLLSEASRDASEVAALPVGAPHATA